MIHQIDSHSPLSIFTIYLTIHHLINHSPRKWCQGGTTPQRGLYSLSSGITPQRGLLAHPSEGCP